MLKHIKCACCAQNQNIKWSIQALTLDSTIGIAPNKKHIKDKSQFQLGSQNEPELTDQQRTAELESSTNQKCTKCKNGQK